MTHKYTATAFEAAAAFVADKRIDACVSWAPDIYNIPEKVTGTRILTTTADANKLIADVWAARADFAKDHPEIVKGLVAGIFEGMDQLAGRRPSKAQAFQWMAEGYGMPVDDVRAMENDAHSTNFAENKDFFLNANDPANFERTWKNVTFVYRELGLIGTPVRFDEVMDFSVIKQLDGEGVFKHQQDEYRSSFAPTTYKKSGRGPHPHPDHPHQLLPELRQHLRAGARRGRQARANTLYDPSVDATLEKVARLAGPVRARGHRGGRAHRLAR